ncbi:MAG: toll/interleukin-1 receptor domain-containing protein, partial [Anaerolineae bacterium]|nr:toll/interleukin-1 receptor domain-containing protein [Anaerolineae bacterium]
MTKIFISYRRADSQHITGRIYDYLSRQYGKKNVFRDIYRPVYGKDFREKLSNAINDCDIFLVIINDKWANITNEKGRRLDQEDDPVRMELELAFERSKLGKCLIIPVLIDNTIMPNPSNMPPSIAELFRIDAPHVRDNDFEADMQQLVISLNKNRGIRSTITEEFLRLSQNKPFRFAAGIAVFIFALLIAI